MNRKKPDAIWLYAVCIILAFSLHVIDHRSRDPGRSTVCFGLALLSEAGILLGWLISIRRRLLPSPARMNIAAVAMLFLFFLAVSAVNYRIADQNDMAVKRFFWYLYYIPLLFVPSLFLITCLSISPVKKGGAALNVGCLVLSGVFAVFVLTNDLHRLVFYPIDPDIFVTYGGYQYGVLYYVGVAFVGLEMVFGAFRLAVLFRKRRQLLLVLLPLVLLPLYVPLSLVEYIIFHALYLTMPQYCIFCMGCFFELCIRFRLIPYNENYSLFFAGMRYPSVITDKSMRPVYRTAVPLRATPTQLRQALNEPLYLSEDLRLSGRRLKAGSVFFVEDESELNRMNDRLTDANEMLETEHTLIKAENNLREQRARLESRSRIFAQISEKTLSRQNAVAELLDGTSPEKPDFNRVIARVSLLNAYIKRSANLLLVSEGENRIDGRELTLALEETARYLRYLGVNMEVAGAPPARMTRLFAFRVYETFETFLEASLPGMTRLYAVLSEEELRMVTDAAVPSLLPDAPLPFSVRRSDGLTYCTVRLEGRHAE